MFSPEHGTPLEKLAPVRVLGDIALALAMQVIHYYLGRVPDRESRSATTLTATLGAVAPPAMSVFIDEFRSTASPPRVVVDRNVWKPGLD